MTFDAGRWIAVLTHANCETKAEFHLRRQGYEIYLPRYLKLVRHAHRRDHLPRPLFPRYLFARLMETDSWCPIRSTIGVSGIVCNGSQPTTVPSAVIGEIRAREDDNGMVRINSGRSFRPGERVRVEAGSLSGLEGIFESNDEGERVTILLDVLGRRVKSRMPLEAIRAIA
jgi:transcriptional antiterminator RfaH